MTLRHLKLKEIKHYTRYHSFLSEDMNRLKNRLQKCIDIVFPEFNSLFKSKYSRSYMALLKRFQTAFTIANAKVDDLEEALHFEGCGRRSTLTVEILIATAQQSIGEHNVAMALKIKHLMSSIEKKQSQLDEVDKKIEDFALNSKSPIYTILGIATYSGTAIPAEIGNLDMFPHPSKVVAYAGVDPSVYLSGEFNAPTTAISKRGSPYLRKVLYQIALTVCKYNTVFNTYYKRKREEGKSHRCAQGHVVRKLLRVIFKLVSENVAFDEAALL